MIRVEAHIPDIDKEGKGLPEYFFVDLEVELLTLCTGFSISKEEGVWRDTDGTIYREDNYVYRIDVADPIVADLIKNKLTEIILTDFCQKQTHILVYDINEPYSIRVDNSKLVNDYLTNPTLIYDPDYFDPHRYGGLFPNQL